MDALLEKTPPLRGQLPLAFISSYREFIHALSSIEKRVTLKTVQKAENVITQNWLLEKCRHVSGLLTPADMAKLIVEACKSSDFETKLFEILGGDEASVNLLFEEIAPNATSIAELSADFAPAIENKPTSNNGNETAILWKEYEEAANLAAVVCEETKHLEGQTITKASDKLLLKQAKALAKKAAQLKARLPVDPDREIFSSYNFESNGQQPSVLAPAGTKQYYEQNRFPAGTQRTDHDGYELVHIPPPVSNYKKLAEQHSVTLDDVMDGNLRRLFSGVKKLNPMQSKVFEFAFRSRGNLLVCAPTGAGKTNVALLSVAAHLRDENILSRKEISDPMAEYRHKMNSTGGKKKIVYVAPMKALAAEVTGKFGQKLKPLGLTVREFTGDTQLSKSEAEGTDVLVTTPEKWDVVTRKGGALAESCGLLIIDEVHLLAEERGSVIESIVARLHRFVETSQTLCRIVGLSATLPNYDDVASFLKARCFFFGPEYRPVPLEQTFIGVTDKSWIMKEKRINMVCLKNLVDSLNRGHQVLIFVHSRKATSGTLNDLLGIARNPKELAMIDLDGSVMDHFSPDYDSDQYSRFESKVRESRSREVQNLFQTGMGIHHAGMLRSDRTLSEELFASGIIRILCCTATLAWGVNLPAHTVIIRGTGVYNAEKGKIVQLGILDVQQIFGRAGRPQFDKSGEAILITSSQENLNHYMSLMVSRVPIESGFFKNLADHLNAEIVASTVTTLSEAIEWLHYTYFYTRMMKSPISYAIPQKTVDNDPSLNMHLREVLDRVLQGLDEGGLCKYHQESGKISKNDLGRVASYYYVQTEALGIMAKELAARSGYEAVLDLLCGYTGFENVRVRSEELQEIDLLKEKSCPIDVTAPLEEYSGKCCVLLQAYISRTNIKSFTLISDTNFLISSAERITRALLDICLLRKYARLARCCLTWCNAANRRIWWFGQTPLRHFDIPQHTLIAIETHHQHHDSMSSPLDHALSLLDMPINEVSSLCKLSSKGGKKGLTGQKIINMVKMIPLLGVEANLLPLTQSMMRLEVKVTPQFEWSAKYHGFSQAFWLLVEDENNERIYHHENLLLTKHKFLAPLQVDVIIPVFQTSLPSRFYVRLMSDSWVGCETLTPVSTKNLIVPVVHQTITPLNTDLPLLPIRSIGAPYYTFYPDYTTFNRLQTQVYNSLHNSDKSILLAAPTGSGKSLCIEMAIFRLMKTQPSGKCLYLAPVQEKLQHKYRTWKRRFGKSFKVTKLNDTNSNNKEIKKSDIIMCTPTQWDEMYRHYGDVGVRLIIVDAAHLVGEDRGLRMEALVTRAVYRSSEHKVRILLMTETLANPADFAEWIHAENFFNFSALSRPVKLVPHIQGFPGRHYVPKMNSMNKPAYAAIREYASSAEKPVVIFVSSRSQSRLTALDLISHAASDETIIAGDRVFLNCDDEYVQSVIETVSDRVLKHTLSFGIGLYHKMLSRSDREIVENMHSNGEIKVLVATSTSAWGLHSSSLVIVKGTEQFNAASRRYVDYEISDLLQMCHLAGRACRDGEGVVTLMVSEDKKAFLKRFISEPFSVESCLSKMTSEFLNSEIACGKISSSSDAVRWLKCSFFFRRLKRNPCFYGADGLDDDSINIHLEKMVQVNFRALKDFECVTDLGNHIVSTVLGRAAHKYNLDFRTPKQLLTAVQEIMEDIRYWLGTEGTTFAIDKLPADIEGAAVGKLLHAFSETPTFSQLPIRYEDDQVSLRLAEKLPWRTQAPDIVMNDRQKKRTVSPDMMSSPHVKCFLLLQAYISRSKMPSRDYSNDAVHVVDKAMILLDAVNFICSNPAHSNVADFTHMVERTRQVLREKKILSYGPVPKHSIRPTSAPKALKKDAAIFKPRKIRKADSVQDGEKLLSKMDRLPPDLVDLSQEERKKILGGRLFKMIKKSQPDRAPKITGMFLEMGDFALLHLLENPDVLESKVIEAVSLLDTHKTLAV